MISTRPQEIFLKGNDIFPNSKFPALLYKNALKIPWFFPARYIKSLFKLHHWTNNWRNGIYTYHHYHSNTHEAMAVIKGSTSLILGGENGIRIRISKGDLIVIPAGVAHRNEGKQNDVICIGGYPEGKDFDMNYGKPEERPKADRNIARVPLPEKGPLSGIDDPLHEIWKKILLSEKDQEKQRISLINY